MANYGRLPQGLGWTYWVENGTNRNVELAFLFDFHRGPTHTISLSRTVYPQYTTQADGKTHRHADNSDDVICRVGLYKDRVVDSDYVSVDCPGIFAKGSLNPVKYQPFRVRSTRD